MIAETRSMQGWGGQGRAARAGQGRGDREEPKPMYMLGRVGQGRAGGRHTCLTVVGVGRGR